MGIDAAGKHGWVGVVLDAGSYAEANEILVAMGVPKLSRQAWALVPKIVEAADTDTDTRVVEVHPEVSFCELAGECEVSLGRRVAIWC